MSSIFVGKAENYDFLSLLNIPIKLDCHNHPLLFSLPLIELNMEQIGHAINVF